MATGEIRNEAPAWLRNFAKSGNKSDIPVNYEIKKAKEILAGEYDKKLTELISTLGAKNAKNLQKALANQRIHLSTEVQNAFIERYIFLQEKRILNKPTTLPRKEEKLNSEFEMEALLAAINTNPDFTKEELKNDSIFKMLNDESKERLLLYWDKNSMSANTKETIDENPKGALEQIAEKAITHTMEFLNKIREINPEISRGEEELGNEGLNYPERAKEILRLVDQYFEAENLDEDTIEQLRTDEHLLSKQHLEILTQEKWAKDILQNTKDATQFGQRVINLLTEALQGELDTPEEAQAIITIINKNKQKNEEKWSLLGEYALRELEEIENLEEIAKDIMLQKERDNLLPEAESEVNEIFSKIEAIETNPISENEALDLIMFNKNEIAVIKAQEIRRLIENLSEKSKDTLNDYKPEILTSLGEIKTKAENTIIEENTRRERTKIIEEKIDQMDEEEKIEVEEIKGKMEDLYIKVFLSFLIDFKPSEINDDKEFQAAKKALEETNAEELLKMKKWSDKDGLEYYDSIIGAFNNAYPEKDIKFWEFWKKLKKNPWQKMQAEMSKIEKNNETDESKIDESEIEESTVDAISSQDIAQKADESRVHIINIGNAITDELFDEIPDSSKLTVRKIGKNNEQKVKIIIEMLEPTLSKLSMIITTSSINSGGMKLNLTRHHSEEVNENKEEVLEEIKESFEEIIFDLLSFAENLIDSTT